MGRSNPDHHGAVLWNSGASKAERYTMIANLRIIVLFTIVLVLSACGTQDSQQATAQALAESISLTATANASGVLDSSAKLLTAEAQ
jgi:hypothetical protein